MSGAKAPGRTTAELVINTALEDLAVRLDEIGASAKIFAGYLDGSKDADAIHMAEGLARQIGDVAARLDALTTVES